MAQCHHDYYELAAGDDYTTISGDGAAPIGTEGRAHARAESAESENAKERCVHTQPQGAKVAGQRDEVQSVIRQARVGRAESERAGPSTLCRGHRQDGYTEENEGIEIKRFKSFTKRSVCATARRAPLVAPEGLSGMDAS